MMKIVPYESAFGTLMHLMVTMSANIAHVVNIIIIIHYSSGFKYIFKYIRNTTKLGITFSGE